MGAWGMFFRVGLKAHIEAWKELLVITIISIAPIGLGALVRLVRIENQEKTLDQYVHQLDGLLERGELFMCALAFIAVIAWHVMKEWPPALRPPRVTFGMFCLLSFGVVSLFYSLDANKIALHQDLVIFWSKSLFIVTLGIYYLSTVLTKFEAPDLATTYAESAASISDGLRRRK